MVVKISWGLVIGLLGFFGMLALPAPAGMPDPAWKAAALVFLMATWWMTQAIPLTATALLPFVTLPFMDILTAKEVAQEYYSPTLFLILGGAFIALAIERTGLHRRLALAIISRAGKTTWGLLLAFMASSAILSMIISNTSTTLIMVPIAVAVLAAGGVKLGETNGFAGALVMGVAFASSIGGVGTIVGAMAMRLTNGVQLHRPEGNDCGAPARHTRAPQRGRSAKGAANWQAPPGGMGAPEDPMPRSALAGFG
jgi:sodium-dependent dicarboxylate transporter 2/3/5